MIKRIKADTGTVRAKGGPKYRVYTKTFVSLVFCIMLVAISIVEAQAQTVWPHVAFSKDGTPISYEVHGTGEPTLVFVHGWSCDARYWREQVPYFSEKHRVVTLDLAGHGHSGMSRKNYTMKAFGDDVRAVTAAGAGSKVILVGHSMGGSVIAEAARLMPGRVIGLIGIDNLENIEYRMTPEEFQMMVAPLENNFREGSRQFVGAMIASGTDPQLREWILSDVSAAPARIALSAMKEMMTQYTTGEAAKVFEEIPIPVITVNTGLWPINYEANRRHMLSYNATILNKTDHFLMMDHPQEFNKALEKAILMLSKDDGGSK